MNAVACGAAISILPVFLAKCVKTLKSVLTKETAVNRAYWMSVHDDMKGRPLIKFVLGEIKQAVRADRDRFLMSD